MNPTNLAALGCDPISSNCIIWQGPDLPCISLCKGDTVSRVVYLLAVELCTLKDTFKISEYDLACFNLAQCTPQNFQELIQLLINRICDLEGVTPPSGGSSTSCPDDCVVPVCSAFQYYNPSGDLVTSMPLTDYVLAIGNRLCTIIGQITTINNSLANHELRITTLENTPPPAYNPPQVTPTCVLPAVPTQMNVVLTALEQQFCQLRNYTGNTQDILQGMQAQCQGLNAAPVLHGIGTMAGIPGWYVSPSNWAQSYSNLWKTVCDLRNAVQFIQNNCCDTGCAAIDLDVYGEVLNPTTLRLTFSGSIPGNYVDAPIGSTVTINDAIGGGPQVINGVHIKSAYYDAGQQYTLTLVGVNGALDLNVLVTARFMDPVTQNVCESVVQILVLGTNTCPALVLAADYTGINFSFTWNGTTPIPLTLELWNNTMTIMEQSQVINVTTNSVSGSFINLTEGTTYNIRLVINGQPCEFVSFVTLVHPCVAPTLNAPTLLLTVPEGATTGSTIAAWQVEYDFYHP